MNTFLQKLAITSIIMLLIPACSGKYGKTGYDGSNSSMTNSNVSEAVISELQSPQVGDRVFFAFDSSSLNTEANSTLDRQAEFMRRYPNLQFEIEGHCDNRGSTSYNMALGERRGHAVASQLRQLGIDSSRLTVQSYGSEFPVAEGNNEAAWSQNRRGVTTIKGHSSSARAYNNTAAESYSAEDYSNADESKSNW